MDYANIFKVAALIMSLICLFGVARVAFRDQWDRFFWQVNYSAMNYRASCFNHRCMGYQEVFQTVCDTLETANAEAEHQWGHLSGEEKRKVIFLSVMLKIVRNTFGRHIAAWKLKRGILTAAI